MMKAHDLTLEEKASLTSGASFWHTGSIPRASIPAIMLTDGPHGLRKQAESANHLGLHTSVPATCFPPAVALGSSWDTDLVHRVGVALGQEASIENVAVLLGPGINIKRSPLCGRNFEYLSEDPILTGLLGAAWVRGVQSQGVGTSLKHFAANNQEHDRMRSSSDVDERTLREIYLRGFQLVVQDAQPWTVMCSYNKINGVYASQNPWLLTDVLRGEWGFTGLVVSDWGAVAERVPALRAGLDLEMPSTGGRSDAEIVAAVRGAQLDESVLDTAAQRILDLVAKGTAGAGRVAGPLDVDAHHAIAREAAGRSIVLLRNEGAILPLDPQADIAVIGAFAENPRYQGAGSSQVNPTRIDNALDAIREVATKVSYAPAFSLVAESDEEEARALREEAVSAARGADVAVVFLGVPDRIESEGFDRESIELPAEQLAVLDAVLEVNPNVVVVLSNGAVVALPFAGSVPGIVEAWLLGQAGGSATADVLFGAVNPSAKLTETIPLRLQDTPAYLNFPGERSHVRYGEGLFVGYRWYDARELEVAYPFGHGLSYTTFEYGEASTAVRDDGDIDVTLAIRNSGDVNGREIVQVYSSLAGGRVQRPVRELKGFASVALAAGERKLVTITLRLQDLAYWDVRASAWIVEPGRYTLDIGASSRDIRCTVPVEIVTDDVQPLPLTRESSLAETLAHPIAGLLLRPRIQEALRMLSGGDEPPPADAPLDPMITSMPIGRLGVMGGDAVSLPVIDELIAQANQAAR